MSSYLSHATTPATQREPLPRQIANSAGGFSFAVDDWVRLRRFLVLGSEGGSYYANERALTRESAACVERCVQVDGARAVREIAELSESGRAPKNDPAILALALAARSKVDATRAAAYAALPRVCRTGTHLYHFVEFADKLGGWGRGMRRAIALWFDRPDAAYQLVKYQRRDGWSARDLIRLSHPKPTTETQQVLIRWAIGDQKPDDVLPPLLDAVERLKSESDLARVCALVSEHRVPREAIPTQWLTKPEVWEAMLPHTGLTAVVRNLATMTRIGLLAPLSGATALVCSRVTDEAELRKARVHPIAVLSALRTYQKGRGERGQHTWTPVPQVADALDAAFYKAFAAVTPAGKRTLIALDVSGSMAGGEVAGVPGLTPREASVAMAMVTAATEPQSMVMGFGSRFTAVDVSPRRRLSDNIAAVSRLGMQRTDCSLPMRHARQYQWDVDTFIVYTDSETYAGPVHPTRALEDYRRARNIPAKEAVVGLVSNGFTIADPLDAGQLDVVGFDAAAPALIADFSRE